MLKNKKKIFLIFLICLYVFQTSVFGGNINVNRYNPNINDPLDQTTQTIIGKVLGIVTAVGSVAAIGFLILIGIRFMLGSVEEKAQYKESLKPYLIGTVLLFAILQIVDVLYNVGTGLTN